LFYEEENLGGGPRRLAGAVLEVTGNRTAAATLGRRYFQRFLFCSQLEIVMVAITAAANKSPRMLNPSMPKIITMPPLQPRCSRCDG
jgi:hypothetical protein